MATDENVICGAHGETPVTVVCRHLSEGVACGFHAQRPTKKNPWPDAWCDACEDVFRKAGKWTTRATKKADIQLLCTFCYEEARDRNRIVPKLARGKRTKLAKAEAGELFHHAIHAAQHLQYESDKRWHWSEHARWDIDHDKRTLTFSTPKRAKLVADVRHVGSFSTKSNTFQWAWKTIDDGEAVNRLRAFGEVRGLKELTTANFLANEATGWRMAALAAYVLGAEALYRPPSGRDLFWFVLLSKFRRVRATPKRKRR